MSNMAPKDFGPWDAVTNLTPNEHQEDKLAEQNSIKVMVIRKVKVEENEHIGVQVCQRSKLNVNGRLKPF